MLIIFCLELAPQIIDKLVNKEHLNFKGLEEIISIVSSMNLGLPSWAQDPDLMINNNSLKITPVTRPLIESSIIPYPQCMAGFISLEGSFSIIEDKYISLSFRVSQHSKDEELLKSFVNYFG